MLPSKIGQNFSLEEYNLNLLVYIMGTIIYQEFPYSLKVFNQNVMQDILI